LSGLFKNGYLIRSRPLLDTIKQAESFISGFEDDPDQAPDEPCEADHVWFGRRRDFVHEEFAEALKDAVRAREDLFPDEELHTESGHTLTLDEIDRFTVTSEVSAKTPPIAVCEEVWNDPEQVWELLDEERRRLLRNLGVSPEDAVLPPDTSGSGPGVDQG